MNPSTDLVVHYAKAILEVENSNESRRTLNLDEVLSEVDIDEMSADEMDSYLKYKFAEKENNNDVEYIDEYSDDSNSSKVIQFKPKGTMH